MSLNIKLKHSSVQDKAPQPSDLTEGELALNVNANSPAAYIKDSAGNVVKLAGVGAVGSDDQWTRTGTELAPTNAGDDVFTRGDVKVGNTTGAPKIELKADGGADFAGGLFTIDSTNRVVGIGLTNPSADLNISKNNPHVQLQSIGVSSTGQYSILARAADDTAYRVNVKAADESLTFGTGGVLGNTYTPIERARIDKTGNMLIGGTLPSAPNISLKADGTATFTGTVTATVVPPSDAKFKDNISPASPQLADVVALGNQLKNFDWNADAPVNDEIRAQRQLGLIAQEAEKVCPSLVKTIKRTKQGKELTPEQVIPAVYEDRQDPEDEENWIQELVTPEQTIPATYEELDDSYKGISHDALIMKLLGAIAELKAEVDALKSA